MNGKRIPRLFAAVFVLFGCLMFSLSEFDIDILGSLSSTGSIIANYVLIILFFISVLYLVFTPDIETKDDAHKRRRQWFEIAGIIVIVICFPLKFFYPKAEFPIVLIALLPLYYIFFLRKRAKQG